MNTYLKFTIIAALLITTGAISVLGESQESASNGTEPNVAVQSSSKKSTEAASSSTKLENESTGSTSEAAAEPATTDSSAVPVQSEEAEQPAETEEVPVVSEEAQTAPENTPEPALEPKEAPEVNTRPAPPVNEAVSEQVTEAPAESTNAAQPAPVSIQANQMKINGQFISYSNAGQGNGQAIIDANHNQVATWGGASVQSGNDGANTHFIGHNPGIFNVLFSLGNGQSIEVSDSANNVTTYTISHIVTVDDYGMAADGTDYWDQITGSGGGERITLQTCINDDYNLIVFANK